MGSDPIFQFRYTFSAVSAYPSCGTLINLTQLEIVVPRPNRICIPGFPHHVIQRGNDRQATFRTGRDYFRYLEYLKNAATENGVAVHAYVLMTNHTHLLVTPSASTSLSLTFQSLGRRYVTYVNKTYQRTGTLWEGRFKSSVVDNDFYCLACYQYIELNPVRAAMVSSPEDYRWSSFAANGLGRADDLIAPHAAYQALAPTRSARAAQYRRMIGSSLKSDVIEQLRFGARKGLPVGSARFKKDIEKRHGHELGTGQVGRPRLI